MRVLTWRPAAAALIAAWLLSSAGAYAQAPSPPSVSNQRPDVSDQKLDAAAAAIERVATLKQDYQQRITAAPPSDKQRISDEAMSAIAKAVVDQGLSVEEYISILDLAQSDPDVHEKIIQRIRPAGK
jgi:Domain of unknown function (DUF4168)